jgi:hypothetical protein
MNQSLFMETGLILVNSSKPYILHSLPIPLYLTPPQGKRESLLANWLIKTLPVSNWLAIY